jgi:1-acyl-sn-glycerol-3-phosphate acyltransferase
MSQLRALIKCTLQILMLITFVVYSMIGRLFIRNFHKRRRFHVKTIGFFAKICCWNMSAKVTVKGDRDLKNHHYLLVSNHTGFADIACLCSVFPALFITSLDMKHTPALGTITDMAGCLYVNRKNRANIQNEINEIRKVLEQGFNVVLFPEAAAMSGEKIYPFKKTLLTAVAGTDIPILPAVVNFTKVNGQPMSHKWRDSVFWHGKLPFLGVAWRCHALKSIEVEITFLEAITCPTEDQRREVAALAQKMIESHYVPIPYPDGQGPQSN